MSKTSSDMAESKRGRIRHVHKQSANKGIEMLRLEREMDSIIARWRAAVKANPKDWK